MSSHSSTACLWDLPPFDPEAQVLLARALSISPVLAQCLINRGISTVESASEFLNPDLGRTPDPWTLPDMAQAVERLATAIHKKERIVVYGDYDADGQSAAALTVAVLRRFGAKVGYYIPHRVEEGYGLNQDAISAIAASGAQLLVTVDCGITAVREVEWARGLGLDVIITDHHQPPDELPRAMAAINPHRRDSLYTEPLAGVGVAYKLCQALVAAHGNTFGVGRIDLDRHLDFVALGTIADSVPLLGENRALACLGLRVLSNSPALGIRAMMEEAGLAGSAVTSGTVAWTLAPRLNAAGRMGDATTGVRLLLADAWDEARRLATLLGEENRRRQAVEADVLDQAVKQLDREPEVPAGIVAAGTGWHPGVVGIVASRLVERYARPALVLAVEGDAAKGSGRSMEGFDLHAALVASSDLLDRFGGHPMAVGLQLAAGRLPELQHRFAALVRRWQEGCGSTARHRPDGLISVGSLSMDLLEEIDRMAPFGTDNPPPQFLCRGLRVRRTKRMGSDRSHIRITFADPAGGEVEGVAFRKASLYGPVAEAAAAADTSVEVLAQPERNVWNGIISVQFRLQDFRLLNQPFETRRRPAGRVGFDSSPDLWELAAIPPVVWAESHQGAPQAPRPPIIRDARGTGSPESLSHMLIAQSPSLPIAVYVRTSKDAHKLADRLTRWVPNLGDACRIWDRTAVEQHLRDPELQKGTLEATVYIATLPLPTDVAVSRWVFFHIPPSAEKARALLAGGPPGEEQAAGELWLMYSEGDREMGERLLLEMYPDRERLGSIYRHVERLAGSENPLRWDPRDLMGVLNSSPLSTQGMVGGLRFTADVLCEVGLASWDEAGERLRIHLRPASKVDLADSLQYNEGICIRDAFNLYSHASLNDSTDALLRWLIADVDGEAHVA